MIIAEINVIILLVASILTSVFYVKSVGPAALEEKIGEIAYEKCGRYRMVSALFEGVITINAIIYFLYPLNIPLPQYFPWDYRLTALTAIIILLPSLYIMYIGARDAGEESLKPQKDHELYSGIYEKIRHPQALGESWLFLVIALFLNSPFLALYSLIWFPIFYYWCVAEERDLVLRFRQPYIEYRERTGMFIPKRISKKGDE